jgi:hypothetical protein
MNKNQIVESLVKKILNETNTNIGGPFQTDLENGPKNHGARALGNWQSDNAWDIFAPAGSVVNSYTNGKVLKVKASGKRSGKIYGTQVTVTGDEGYPNIFYTHLKNVKLQSGDVVKIGDRIGEVSEWDTSPKSTHVHIGLPRGNHLRDLLKNSSLIFTGKGEEQKPNDSKEKEVKTYNKVKEKPKTGFEDLNKFFAFLTGTNVVPDSSGSMLDPAEDEIETDDQETQTSNVPSVDVKNYKITEPSNEDKDFYSKVLQKLGAPVSKQNLLFFYAWRQAEGAKSTYNPFNTTQKKENSTLWNCLSKKDGRCVGGVRNYKTKQDGIDATVTTLKNGHYNCIVDGLKSDKGATNIAGCSAALKTWGTRGGILRVLNTKKINPPQISKTEVKVVKEGLNEETQRINQLIEKL